MFYDPFDRMFAAPRRNAPYFVDDDDDDCGDNGLSYSPWYRAQQQERARALQRQKELQRHREIERQRELQKQREIERQRELQRQREIQRQRELERQREEYFRQKEIQEMQRQRELQQQREWQRTLELQRLKKEQELQRQLNLKKKQEELNRLAELQRFQHDESDDYVDDKEYTDIKEEVPKVQGEQEKKNAELESIPLSEGHTQAIPASVNIPKEVSEEMKNEAAKKIQKVLKGAMVRKQQQLPNLKMLREVDGKVGDIIRKYTSQIEAKEQEAAQAGESYWKENSLAPKEILGFEEELLQQLLRLDTVNTHGSEFVRQQRKALVTKINTKLQEIDALKKSHNCKSPSALLNKYK